MHIRSITIIVPCFNERETVGRVLEKLDRLDLGDRMKEVIVVDDGSMDGSSAAIDHFADRFRVFHLPENQGKGAAVRFGAEKATGEFLVVQDADLEVDPFEIRKLIEVAEQNPGAVICGTRMRSLTPPAGSHRLYFFGGFLLTKLVNFLFNLALTDVPMTYKLIRADLFRNLGLTSNGFTLETELVARLAQKNYPLVEVPVGYTPRSITEGKKLRLNDGLRALLVVTTLYLKHTFSPGTLSPRQWLRRYSHETIIVSVSLIASAVVFLLLLGTNPDYIFERTHGTLYQLAVNLRTHGVYSDSTSPPFVPHSAYTPLYPILISPLINLFPLYYLVNWFLRAAAGVLLYRLALRVRIAKTPALAGALAFSAEPYFTLLSNGFNAEMLFTTLLLLAVLSIFSYLEHEKSYHLALGAGFLSLATLTRPVSQFLFILIPLVAVLLHKKNLVLFIRDSVLALLIFILILSPWLLRNKIIYDVWSLSSLPALQFLQANLPHFFEWKEKGEKATEKNIFARYFELKREVFNRTGINFSSNFPNPREAKIVMQQFVFPIVKENAPEFFLFYLTQFPFILFTDNWRTAFETIFKLEPSAVTPLSASLAAATGNFEELFSVFRNFDMTFVIFIMGKVFLLLLYILASLGVYYWWREGKVPRSVLIIFIGLILYFPFVQLPYLEARYRFPGTPYLFVLAAAGMEMAARSLGKGHLRRI